jgi:hypothetical protein
MHSLLLKLNKNMKKEFGNKKFALSLSAKKINPVAKNAKRKEK